MKNYTQRAMLKRRTLARIPENVKSPNMLFEDDISISDKSMRIRKFLSSPIE